MKKLIFYVLLWAVAPQAIFAQKALPPSLQPYAVNWRHTVVKSMQRLGYQMPTAQNEIAKTTGVKDRSSLLQLDSTKTFYAYDVPFPGDSTPLFRSQYRYEPLNTKIEENEQFENGTWLKINRTTFLSDGQGRNVEITAEVFNDSLQHYIPDSRLKTYPRNNSQTLLDSIFAYRWEPQTQAWTLIFATLNQYGPNDRLLESRSLIDLFGQPIWLKDKFIYDANGSNIRVESYGILGGFEIPTSKVENTFDMRQPVETIAYTMDDNGNFAPQSRITRTFVLTDKEKEVNSYEWDLETGDWRQTEATVYDYDNQRRVVAKETVWYHKDEPEERSLLRYAYKEGDNLALESSFVWLDNQFLLTDRKFYYYRGTTSTQDGLADLSLAISPNPTIGQVQILLDEPATITLYDANGGLVSSGVYQPQPTLSLYDLPNGLYFITARTENKMFSGRLVKM